MRTFGEMFGPAMSVQDPDEAQRMREALITEMRQGDKYTRAEAERIVRDNLGYYAGYHSAETQRRVADLFGAPHPVFG